jgi:hypothetical protein
MPARPAPPASRLDRPAYLAHLASARLAHAGSPPDSPSRPRLADRPSPTRRAELAQPDSPSPTHPARGLPPERAPARLPSPAFHPPAYRTHPAQIAHPTRPSRPHFGFRIPARLARTRPARLAQRGLSTRRCAPTPASPTGLVQPRVCLASTHLHACALLCPLAADSFGPVLSERRWGRVLAPRSPPLMPAWPDPWHVVDVVEAATPGHVAADRTTSPRVVVAPARPASRPTRPVRAESRTR